MGKVRNRTGRGFGCEVAHKAVSRRPAAVLLSPGLQPVPRHVTKAWASCVIQGPFSVALSPLRNFFPIAGDQGSWEAFGDTGRSSASAGFGGYINPYWA
jgi:hypothetical protein